MFRFLAIFICHLGLDAPMCPDQIEMFQIARGMGRSRVHRGAPRRRQAKRSDCSLRLKVEGPIAGEIARFEIDCGTLAGVAGR